MTIHDSTKAINQFSNAMNYYPVGFKGNRLNLLSIDDGNQICDPSEYLKNLSAPVLMEERREYSIVDHTFWPYPTVEVNMRPDPMFLSTKLFDNFDLALQVIPQQKDIGTIIEAQARKSSPNVVLLMIADGLSYYDISEADNILPLLVNGVTTTEFGYRAVVGHPHISRRLFALGYREISAFSYYPPESNSLSYDLHDPFSASEMIRVKEFNEVLTYLENQKIRRGYIQIVTTGLDHVCHHHHDRPPIEIYKKNLLDRFDQIYNLLRKKNLTVLAYLTSDHGILWRDVIEEKMEIVEDLFQEDIRSPRYIKGAFYRRYGRIIQTMGQAYTLLGPSYMTRKFRNDEWGVHGGISAWESLVPLITLQH